MLKDAAEGDGRGEGEGALLLTLSLRYVLIFWCNVVSMGAIFGLVLVWDIFTRSSADLDHGLRDKERRSPSPPCASTGLDGEEGVRIAWGLVSGMADDVRARERSTTDLRTG